ncbi:bifunctional protein-serine/threonine kinase/phosphatase [Sediminicurvatus halobius]|uniref:Protein kinase n=1 Tax=Sediminicurvatus halobius TaxID=2182432 RepID=A0A2U2MZ14_9GAMM|nr:bifunctional protein-serine/threonine kinase/phosphatase [Spiribacter halobius]PWG61969.1 protein kinase [Spiribacter halobius]UEX78376.1 bifunctional protein-serine/threonine kinase/phosphatase [Spiribacter halobius]
MTGKLSVSIGQHSEAGAKPRNQDACGARVPAGAELASKGVAVALADGISTSEVAHIASETAVTGFLADYYCTSNAWSVKRSGQRVIDAINAWLHGHTDRSWARYDKDRGYVCTFTALVIKGRTGHLFHVGDSRAWRVQGGSLEQLTDDHRHHAGGRSFLGRALGTAHSVEIDYRAFPLAPGDTFVLTTDGVHEHLPPQAIAAAIREGSDDLEAAARALVAAAHGRGSEDNLTAAILRVDRLPEPALSEFQQRVTELPFPPALGPRSLIDGYEIVRELHVSSRSHVFLALDSESGTPVALKVPATELRDDPAALERFLAEEWIARRVDSAHLLKPRPRERAQNYLYVVTEYVDGQTLTQWIRDHPRADFARVRDLVTQIGKGLRALHRQDMIHQDLRPYNVMIDATGTAKLIDFGAVRVAGLGEGVDEAVGPVLGTEQYAAPEYFLGAGGSERSDVFSLAVITYQMLTGQLPYGPKVAQVRSRSGLNRLKYTSVLTYNRACPPWIDGALRKALHPRPERRYAEVSEFLHDLHHPRPEFVHATRPPLIERNPEAFWKGVSLLIGLIALAELLWLVR